MAYTHSITWIETLTKGALAGMEVDKGFPIVNPNSRANQRVLDRLIADPNVRDAQIVEEGGRRRYNPR